MKFIIWKICQNFTACIENESFSNKDIGHMTVVE